MSLTVIMPVFNEERTIKSILYKVIKQKKVSEVLIINDGSTDNSLSIIKSIKSRKIKILNNIDNIGKGFSIRKALKQVKSEFIIFQDADLEYNPSDYIRLLGVAGPSQTVYGSRLLKKNPHAYERTYLGNIFITKFCNILFKTNLTDIYTCYKLLPTKTARLLKLKSNGFEIESEITAKLAKMGIDIIEIPISYQPRSYEQGKKIKMIDGFKGLLQLLRIRFSIKFSKIYMEKIS